MSVADATSQVRAFLEERDVPCPGCGYNLRGLSGTKCPECGRTLSLQELLEQSRVRLGRWFWGGVALDAGAIVLMALRLAGTMSASDAATVVVLGLVVSAAWTSVFVLIVYFRRERLDPETFASELAWAIWVPLFFKLTCLGGMLFGGGVSGSAAWMSERSRATTCLSTWPSAMCRVPAAAITCAT